MRTIRRRYLVFKIDSKAILSRRNVLELLKEASGNEAFSITLLTYVPEIMEGIIRCDHRNIGRVREILNGSFDRAVVRTLRTSGTVRTLKNTFSELSGPRKKNKQDLRKGF
jgi:RNase P/RNase MRP subunit POP5